MHYLNEAEWRIYASVNRAINNGSDYGFSASEPSELTLIYYQLYGPLGKKSIKFESKCSILFRENDAENVVCT